MIPMRAVPTIDPTTYAVRVTGHTPTRPVRVHPSTLTIRTPRVPVTREGR